MLKIGVIGLGDIAQKAYLPLITSRPVEVHLCTRNANTLKEIGDQYQLTNLYQNIELLISSGIHGAFVHTSTSSHYQIAEQLLLNNIHVYVDKPVTYEYQSTHKLFELAKQKGLHLHVGFNRREASAYKALKTIQNPNMIVLQKNRKSLPGDVRTFIFDDFIHVVDTLIWLLNKPVDKLIVNGKKQDNVLYHVVIQMLAADGTTAIGIMNRDSGVVEERLEVFSSDGKRVVNNVVSDFTDDPTNPTLTDWRSTLHKRGFDQLIDNFLLAIELPKPDEVSVQESLLTHKTCEQIVEKLNER